MGNSNEMEQVDLIDRQAAIAALLGITIFKTKHELMQRVNASVQDEQGWLGAVAECLDEIEDLPSAQPEPAIPLSWIEGQIGWLKGLDNAFSTLTAEQILAIMNKWKDEQNE